MPANVEGRASQAAALAHHGPVAISCIMSSTSSLVWRKCSPADPSCACLSRSPGFTLRPPWPPLRPARPPSPRPGRACRGSPRPLPSLVDEGDASMKPDPSPLSKGGGVVFFKFYIGIPRRHLGHVDDDVCLQKQLEALHNSGGEGGPHHGGLSRDDPEAVQPLHIAERHGTAPGH